MQTVDQFFEMKVPMRSIELSALFRGIDNAFQVYANHVMEKLGMHHMTGWIRYWALKFKILSLIFLWAAVTKFCLP